MMKPTPGMNKTILLGKCMCDSNKDHSDINEMIPIRGCPPQPKSIVKALQKAGVGIDPAFFEDSEKGPGLLMSRYEGKPEFDESFFNVA
jgi:Ni,Fe-hydrogenase III small subunit